MPDYKNTEDILKNVVEIKGGNSELTKNYIYYNMPKSNKDALPVYSGSLNSTLGYIDKNISDKIKVFLGPAVIICRKGQSGKMRYIEDEQFTINDDAYVMYVREEYKEKLNLRWCRYNFEELFCKIATSKDGNGTFSKNYAYTQIVEIPDIELQKEQLKNYELLISCEKTLKEIDSKISDFLERVHTSKSMIEYVVSKAFYLDTGKRITTNQIYSNLTKFIGKNDLIPIISSGTQNNGCFAFASAEWLDSNYRRKRLSDSGEWDVWNNQINASFIINEPCITWNTDGDAGTLFYREDIFFPTDHCGVLIPKEQYKELINLKYFVYTQRYSFKQNTDRGNLHKTQMARQKFELPSIDIQNSVVEKIEHLQEIKNKCQEIYTRINELKKKEIT